MAKLIDLSQLSQPTYKFIGSTVPVSPNDRDRWLETDASGTPVYQWFYDAPNTQWLAINLDIASLAASITSGANLRISLPMVPNGSFQIESFDVMAMCTSAHTSTNFYTVNLGLKIADGSLSTVANTTFNTQTLAATTITLYASTITRPFLVTAQINTLGLWLGTSKTLTPTNWDIDSKVGVRRIR